MTMGAVQRHIDAYGERRQEEIKHSEYIAWLNGYYNAHAITSNMSKKAKYPKNPLEIDIKDMKQMSEITGKTEEELKQEEMYMALRIRQANASIEKARTDGKQQDR